MRAQYFSDSVCMPPATYGVSPIRGVEVEPRPRSGLSRGTQQRIQKRRLRSLAINDAVDSINWMSGCADGMRGAGDSPAAEFCTRVGRNVDAWSRCGPFLSEQETLSRFCQRLEVMRILLLDTLHHTRPGKFRFLKSPVLPTYGSLLMDLLPLSWITPNRCFSRVKTMLLRSRLLDPMVFIRTQCWVVVRRIEESLIGTS